MGPYLQKLSDIIFLARPLNALQPLFLFIFGVVVSGGDLRSTAFYASLIALVLLHSAITLWNDLNDIAVDKHNNVKTILTTGYISERSLRYIVLGLVIVGGGIVVALLPTINIIFVGILMLLGWQYSAAPTRASHHPILSMIFLALSYGALPILIGASLGGIDGLVWVFVAAWSLARVSQSLLKDYKDAVGDAQVDKKTFLLRFGHRKVVVASIISLILGYGGVFVFTTQVLAAEYWVYLIALGTIAIGLLVTQRLRLLKASTYQAQHDLFRDSMYIQLGIDGALTLCLMQLSLS